MVKGKSKYADYERAQAQAGAASDAARRHRELESAREQLMQKLMGYKDLLNDKVLMSNRSELEKKEIQGLLGAINVFSSELNDKNVGEGSLTLAVAALNAVLILHGQINELRWRQYEMHKKLEALESPTPLATDDANLES